MLSKIKDVLIIVKRGQLEQYKQILPNGKNLGMNISYKEQEKPNGLPEAFLIGEDFINKDNVALILGDNFFYAQNLTSVLLEATKLNKGSQVILHKVNKPELYGIAKIRKKKIISIKEKPKKFISDKAITGLYFFDNQVVKYSKELKKSKRNELEITDLLKKYNKQNKLKYKELGRGAVWLDTGSIEDFHNASSFVSTIENRQGIKIACLEEIALNNNWISKKKIKISIKFYGKCDYSNYLKSFL